MLDEKKKINIGLALASFSNPATIRARVLVAARAGTYNSGQINRSTEQTAGDLIYGRAAPNISPSV
jgi:hypothetical protein